MKYAIVHDDFMQKFGGAEKVVYSLSEIYPKADIITSISNSLNLKIFKNLKTSRFQKYKFMKKYSKKLFFLYPIIFETLNFDDYDIVISSSSRFAHGIITSPSTMHICYMHSPSRYIWDYNDYIKMQKVSFLQGLVLPFIVSYLRVWDYAAAQRVDYFIANSEYTKERIKKFYNRDSIVIYPPVEINKYLTLKNLSKDFYLYVGRIVEWKRIDIIIESFNKSGKEVHIVGNGDREYIDYLKGLSKENIKFLENIEDSDLLDQYRRCIALIYPQKEDFGITPVEALACGKPVIAYSKGGVLESVVEGKNGLFFDNQNEISLSSTIDKFETLSFSEKDCRNSAKRFSEDIFRKSIKNTVEDLWKKRLK
jgi:glycosyltransferase involved in cell wall biosynthesis